MSPLFQCSLNLTFFKKDKLVTHETEMCQKFYLAH